MAKNKRFKLKAEDIVDLILFGGCIATDKITVDGLPVKYMYRNTPVKILIAVGVFFQVQKPKNILIIWITQMHTR